MNCLCEFSTCFHICIPTQSYKEVVYFLFIFVMDHWINIWNYVCTRLIIHPLFLNHDLSKGLCVCLPLEVPNSSFIHQYLPHGHENIVKYHFSLSFRLWYQSWYLSVMYQMSVSLGSISFSIGPLWIGLINALFKVPGLGIAWPSISFGYQNETFAPLWCFINT